MPNQNVWYIFPAVDSALASACCTRWRERGYCTAVAIDPGGESVPGADLVLVLPEYRGYYDAVRKLCKAIDSEIVVCGGHDISPDMGTDPDEIAAQFRERFPDLFGVMQPTGDLDADGKPFGGTAWAAVSPWIGRGWIDRAYGGNGPHWQEYFHFFGDEELQCVAEKLGVFWQRPDLCQRHDHWQRRGEQRPAYMRAAKANWLTAKRLLETRKASGFPGSEPLCAG